MARSNNPQGRADEAAAATEPAAVSAPAPADPAVPDPAFTLAREIYLRRVVGGAAVNKTPEHIAAEAFTLAEAFLAYAAGRAS